MNASLTLAKADRADAAATAALLAVADTAAESDGYRPFNEQAMLDLAAGRRDGVLLEAASQVVGAAILGGGELDLVITPGSRRNGYAGEAIARLLACERTEVTAWSHGDHPGARALAARYGFEAVRTLLQLRLEPIPAGTGSSSTAPYEISAFRPGLDDIEWTELNALVFAHHPEQGSITTADLADRRDEPWFDAGDFLVAREASGRLVGYNWLKVEPGGPAEGEIYVIGIHPDAAGKGLGRALMTAGLARLRERGCTAATLYVEADNRAAVNLYRSLGFTDHTIDVQYRRAAH